MPTYTLTPTFETVPPLKSFSASEQIVNCLLFLSLWAQVKPRSVELSKWRCGTHACAGGHMATWPDFHALGVFPDGMDGAPMAKEPSFIDVYDTLDSWGVAQKLFGCDFVFEQRAGTRFDAKILAENPRMSNHQLVARRFEEQIIRLQEWA